MVVVNAGFILFLWLRNKETCRVRDLVEIKRRIEATIDDFFVAVDRKNILAYAQNYPEYFLWDDGVISRIGVWQDHEINICLNYEMGTLSQSDRTIIERIVNGFCGLFPINEEVESWRSV